MSDISIRVKGLSKQYEIGATKFRYYNLPEQFREWLKSVFQFNDKPNAGEKTFWALKDVSFEAEHGEIVGVIGRNGAGKSTLLKILSRITEPTIGRAEIYGRIGSLLEVGTGFHPELTGRENIYLSGAILGMKKSEIKRKFDEIVEFAGVEKFIDTPIKHYSSGMHVRLGFAIAAHLEPEILLIDEVLAVGDTNFQKKCLKKMKDVGIQGRTVIFISHDMTAINRLCKRAILIDEGRIMKHGLAHEVVNFYLNSGQNTPGSREWTDPEKAPCNDIVRLRTVRIGTKGGEIVDVVDIRKPFCIEMEYDVLKSDYILYPCYHLSNGEGVLAFITSDTDPAWRRRPRAAGRYISTAWIPGNLLSEGRYYIGAGVDSIAPVVNYFVEKDIVAFQVVDHMEGDSARGDWGGAWGGIVRPLLEWETKFISSESINQIPAM